MSLKDFSIGKKLGILSLTPYKQAKAHTHKSLKYNVQKTTKHMHQKKSNQPIYLKNKSKTHSTKSVSSLLSKARTSSAINKFSCKEKIYEIIISIVMQYADDGDLYQKILEHKKKKQLFQQSQIWSILIQAVIGLKTLHNLNILHRDLKSANIFLTSSGQAKIGDLNVSKQAKNGLLYTQTGTPYYASPQVWKDQPYDSKSDIWSLGCVIYQMTTLQPPFKAQDMQGLFSSVTLGVYPPINSKYSKQLGHIIKLMLQQKPKSRPSAQKIYSSNLIQKKIEQLQFAALKDSSQPKSQLMKTIKIPKKLHYLTDRLPKPNYQTQPMIDQKSRSLKNSPSLPHTDKQKLKVNKSSLPKLNQILQPLGLKNKQKKKKPSQNMGLMVEGRSKVIEEIKQQKQGRNLQKEIREELKRIYKVRGNRSEQHRAKQSSKSIILPPIRL